MLEVIKITNLVLCNINYIDLFKFIYIDDNIRLLDINLLQIKIIEILRYACIKRMPWM
jgi:hypothetical protein